MKTLDDEIRHILDYDSEETVALTFECKARLVKNIVSIVENQFSQPSDVSDEEIEKRFPINVSMIRPCNLSTRNKWIQQGIMWYKSKAMRDGQIKPTIEGEEDSSDGHMAMYGG